MTPHDERFKGWMRDHLAVLHRISRAFAEPADQHDLLQELMITVWKAAASFRGDSAPATFIYRVAHNRAISWRRREFGRIRGAASIEQDWPLLNAGSEDADDAAMLDRLYAVIRMLGILDRSLILLSLEGASYREMSRLHAISEANVGVRLNRARKWIAAQMEAYGDGL
jgi:RNA polymerase sigma-70 factor (ECF subfamily)